MGRKCSVPHCYTGYRQCKDKAALYKVPDDDFFLSKWQDAIARDDRPITPKDYVCEKHFKEEDILRRRIIKDVVEEYQRPKLKPDAIPSVFPDWPEFISKMTKKRRKLPVESDDIIDITINSDEEEIIEPTKDLQQTGEENEMALANEEIDIKTENDESMENMNQEVEDDPLGPQMYGCDECKYKTQYAHNLRTHKTKHMSGSNAFMHCDLCGNYKTKWESVFINHMKVKHGIGLTIAIRCSFCNFKTKVEQCLARHCEFEHPGQITPERTLKCVHQNCGYTAESNYTFTLHMVQEHSEMIRSHPAIQETLDKSNCAEGNAMRGFRAVDERLNSVMQETNPDSSQKHKRPKFSCSRCPYKTSAQTLLQKHLLKHQFTQQLNSLCPVNKIVDTNFNCSSCAFVCSRQADFARHLLSHNNECTKLINVNNNDQEMVAAPNFDIVTVKEDRSSDDNIFSE